MAKCCICGAEATHNTYGLWWCDKHYKYVGEKTKKRIKSFGEIKPEEKREIHPSWDLELAWV